MSRVVAAVRGSNCVKRMPRNAARLQSLQLGVGDARVDHRDTAGALRPKLRDGVERHVIVEPIGRGLHHDGPAGADAPLQQPIVRDAGVGLHACGRRGGGKRSAS